MYKLKHVSETYSDPVATVCQVGQFDGPATRFADIVIEREGINGARVNINHTVLGKALLDGRELLAKICGIVCLTKEEYLVLQKKIELLDKNLNKVKKENKMLSSKKIIIQTEQ